MICVEKRAMIYRIGILIHPAEKRRFEGRKNDFTLLSLFWNWC